MYAIVRAGGRQEKVSVGDVVELNRCVGEPGATVSLPVLLVVDDKKKLTHDRGKLAGSSVEAEIVSHKRGPKIVIGKFKNKTRYRRKQGHRQELTTLKITSISVGK